MLKNLIVLAPLLASIATGGEVTFTRKPTAKRNGTKTVIKFTVNRKTDIAVYIENSEGKVVRHLVAGVLGSSKPAKPLKTGLAQSLIWDGKDDYGKMAVGGPFKVRVGAGSKPSFDGFLLGAPRSTGRIDALAVGPKGRVYVFHKDDGLVHWGSHKIKILDRDGKHHKVILPFAADLEPSRVKALAPYISKEGDLIPHIYQALKFSFYPNNNISAYQMLGQGRHCGAMIPAVDKKGRVYWMSFGPRLCTLDADGGVPYEKLAGPKLLTDVKGLTAGNIRKAYKDHPALAVSGDDKYIYVADMFIQVGKGKKEKTLPLPCVYRVDIKTRSKVEVFVGKQENPGKKEGLLTNPRGMAVANGVLYVADFGAGRIVVFKESDRSYLGEVKVKAPHSIGVDPKTGAIYVASYLNNGINAELIKFDGYKSGKALYKIALPKTGLNPNPGALGIAVDATTKPVRTWVTSTSTWGQFEATYVDDMGDKFVSKKLPRDGGNIYRDITYDRKRSELYVKHGNDWLRINEKTGKVKARLKLKNGIGTQLVAAPDGSLVTLGHWSGSGLIRFDRDGKPLNWPGQKTSRFPYHGIMNFMQRFLAVKSLDEIYVILPPKYLTNRKQFGVTGGTRNTVDELGSDGKPKRTAIWQCTHGAILRVDHKGNIYVADMVTPPGRTYPKFFDGKTGKNGRNAEWMNYLYGSIVKFPPSGGAIWYADQKGKSSSTIGKPSKEFLASPSIKVGAHKTYAKGKAELQGAEWYRFGFAPYGIHNTSGNCSCEGGGFDVDMFGRVFYPNVGQFRVEFVDSANNMIGTFGKYGNQDSGGKDAIVKKPKIPFAWPLTVVTSDTHAYVADSINRRIVKVKLGYRAEASCAVQ
jgi:DNA-binding beta-propeller fold protein YncE